MAEMPEIFIKVSVDPEAQKKLDESMERFRKASRELEEASVQVQHALRRLGETFVMEKS